MTTTDPTSRALRLLALLQSRSTWTGPDLAAELGVTTRSVRRDVDRLRGLGYPIEAERGADGGYRLGSGTRMPPLLLGDEEAVAITVALRLAATGSIEGIGEAASRTLSLLDDVLPPRLRRRVAALDDALAVVRSDRADRVDLQVLTDLAGAVRDRVLVRFTYTGRGTSPDRPPTERLVEPHRLVTSGWRWYLRGWDRDRGDWRTFRFDRIDRLHVTTFAST